MASDNDSDAATPANEVGTVPSPVNVLTVNVQEIPTPSTSQSATRFNLSQYGDLDWFHVTGVPCSNPYEPTTPSPDCPDADGRIGGYSVVEKYPNGPLTWESLVTTQPPSSAYQGVYRAVGGSMAYTWSGSAPLEENAPTATEPSFAGWYTGSGSEHDGTVQGPGTGLEGAFYDPNSKSVGSDYEPGGYKIIVAPDTAKDRVLRFVGGASEATATVTITATDSNGPIATAVPFYSPELEAGQGQTVSAFYTVYIPDGYGAEVEVQIKSVTAETGHVRLGGAALSDSAANPASAAFTPGLPMDNTATEIDVLDAPAAFNLSDPGGTSLRVDGWRHAAIVPHSILSGLYYAQYTGLAPSQEYPVPPDPPALSVRADTCDGTFETPSLNEPVGAALLEGESPGPVDWSAAYTNPGNTDFHYGGFPNVTNVHKAVALRRCADEHDSATFKINVKITSAKDRYLYVFAGASGGDYFVTGNVGGKGLDSVVRLGPADPDDPFAMSLFRVFVPAGATAEIVFHTDDPGARMIFAGTSIQQVLFPAWNTCTANPDGVGQVSWADLLTNQGASDALAQSPYFQQFQLRGLLNTLDLDGDPPLTDFQKGQLVAGYCEAYAWTVPPSDTHQDVHPDPDGYDKGNHGDQDDPEPDGKEPTVENDEEDSTAALKQPMVSLTKRAFVCPGAEGGDINPNTLVKVDHPDTPENEAASDCQELKVDGNGELPSVDSGTRVYWLFTVTNTALFGFLHPLEENSAVQPLTVNDKPSTAAEEDPPNQCRLEWALTPPSAPSGAAAFPATLSDANPTTPVAPGHALACVASEVLK
ncbi:MAG: hypothetical protein LBK59_08225 [Bifidobacteriaceae bacterium]|nr:hypothetical protein [Bifidobacteriaceae bacterium]